MPYRRCITLFLIGLLFMLLVGPVTQVLPLVPALTNAHPTASNAVPTLGVGGAPEAAGLVAEPVLPSIEVYAALELWPFVLSLLLLLSLNPLQPEARSSLRSLSASAALSPSYVPQVLTPNISWERRVRSR